MGTKRVVRGRDSFPRRRLSPPELLEEVVGATGAEAVIYPISPDDHRALLMHREWRANNYVAWFLDGWAGRVLLEYQRLAPGLGFRDEEDYRPRAVQADRLGFTQRHAREVVNGDRWLTSTELSRLLANPAIRDSLSGILRGDKLLYKEPYVLDLVQKDADRSGLLLFEEVTKMPVDIQQQHLRRLSESIKDLVRLAADIDDHLRSQNVLVNGDDWAGLERSIASGTRPAPIHDVVSRSDRLREQPTFRDMIRFLVTDEPIAPLAIKARLAREGIPFKIPRVHSALSALKKNGEIEQLSDGSYRRTAIEGKS